MKNSAKFLVFLAVLASMVFVIVKWVQWGNATQLRPGVVIAKHEGRENPGGQNVLYAVLVRPKDSMFSWWCPASKDEYEKARLGEEWK